jgi:hypothetical protein
MDDKIAEGLVKALQARGHKEAKRTAKGHLYLKLPPGQSVPQFAAALGGVGGCEQMGAGIELPFNFHNKQVLFHYAVRNRQAKPTAETKPKARNLATEWERGARKLIPFFKARYFVRKDCHGRYNETGGSYCRKDEVTDKLLLWHCAGAATIGTYTTDPIDQTCQVLHIDIDRHEDNGDPQANLRYALVLYDKLLVNGFNPVLLDSNGRGGFWVEVFFDRRVPAATVRAFGRWLTQDYEDYGVSAPEVFPKQDHIKEDGFGNMFRLPGKHHKRPHYTRLYDGEKWLEGAEAIEALVKTVPVSPDLIPDDSATFQKPPRQAPEPYVGDGGRGQHRYALDYAGDLTTLDLAAIFEEAGMLLGDRDDYPSEVVCPWAGEHSDGREQAYLWQNSDDDDNRGWPGFYCHHAHCAGRGLADVLAFFGPEKVDGHCRRTWQRASAQPVEPSDLDAIVKEAPPIIVEAPAGEQDLERYKNDPRTAYLWCGCHGEHLNDEMRRRRVESIDEVWRYIPQSGFFPEYIMHWLPTTDAPVIFHLGAALVLAAALVHRKVYVQHGATTIKAVIWAALLAGSSKMRKSICINRATDTLPASYSDILLPPTFTVPSLLSHLGVVAKTRDELNQEMVALLERQRDNAADLSGVGLLGIDELRTLLATLNMRLFPK